MLILLFFFFQAEDGIRDRNVTGSDVCSSDLQLRNSAGMDDCGPDVINQLLLDELLAIEDRVEHFAHRERRGGVATNQAKTFLQRSEERRVGKECRCRWVVYQ